MTNTELRKRFEIIFTDLVGIAVLIYMTGEFDAAIFVVAVQAVGFVIFDLVLPAIAPEEQPHGDSPV